MPSIARQHGEASRESDGAPLAVLVWNIQSPELSTNVLEFMPGDGVLSEAGQQTMQQLLDTAHELMVSSQTSPTLQDLLGDAPLQKVTPLESSELNDNRALLGLETWLDSRRATCNAIWPGMDARWLVEAWQGSCCAQTGPRR